MEDTATPTFEDLSIEEGLSDLQKLVKYSKSGIALQKVVHARMLSDVAKTSTLDEIIEQIFPLLELLMVDYEVVIRQNLLEQLPLLAAVCLQKEVGYFPMGRGYDAIIVSILPVIRDMFVDSKISVRTGAVDALVKVCKLMKPEDLSTHVLTIILQLAHDEENEDIRITAVEVLNMSAECLGLDICKQFVIPEAVSLSEDPAFRVRRAVALNLTNICKVGGEEELFERLMPAFVALSKDDMYRVRKACADSLVDISNVVSNDIRVGVLTEIFWRLSGDSSKFVKQSVLQNSGMFISTLPSGFISSMVLNPYLSLISDPIGDDEIDKELSLSCAFSFPGVFQAMGSSRWSELKDLYYNLVQRTDPAIRHTLAASLHEIAKIFGDESKAIIESELASVFEDMIQDANEDTHMVTLKYLATFLKYLPEMARISYLLVIHDIVHSADHLRWRLRHVLASQMSELIDLPPKHEVYNTLFPLVSILLHDPVSCVRIAAYKGAAKLLLVVASQANIIPGGPSYDADDETDRKALSQSQQDFSEVILTFNSLNAGERYDSRLTWIELCHTFLCDPKFPQDLFRKYFIEGILALTTDTVVNVRNGVAILLTGWAMGGQEQPWPAVIVPVVAAIKGEGGETEMEVGAASTTEGADAALAPTSSSRINLFENVDSSGISSNNSNNNSNINSSSSSSSTSSSGGGGGSSSSSNNNNEANSSNNNSSNSSSSKTNPWSWLLSRPDIREAVRRLSRDDPDIFDNMRKLKPFFPDIKFEVVSCRGVKVPPGGSAPIRLSNPMLNPLDIDIDIHNEVRDSFASSYASEHESEAEGGAQVNRRRSSRKMSSNSIDISTVVLGASSSPVKSKNEDDDSDLNERFVQKGEGKKDSKPIEFLYFENSSSSPKRRGSAGKSSFNDDDDDDDDKDE